MNSNSVIEKIFKLEKQEQRKQKIFLSLIASESLAYPEVLKISSSVLTNKYAEGYPGKRYYSGCEFVDEIENIAIEQAKKTFKCNFANVQSLSGSIANFSIYQAFLKPGDLILGMDLSAGGHLTHTSKVSFVSKIYKTISYSVDPTTEKLDYEKIQEIALQHKPKLIIAGGSSYSYQIDFEKFKAIADSVGAYLFADIAHLSGLIISSINQHCFPFADVAMATTHKQLKGPRGAIILWNKEEYTNLINKSVFPGTQGGPQPQLIAAKGIALAKASEEKFTNYFKQVVSNASTISKQITKLGGVVVAGGTNTHLLVINVLKTFGITGDIAEDWLLKARIIVNKNVIAGDTNPSKPSGIRIGTLIGTELNFKEKEFLSIANIIYSVLLSQGKAKIINSQKKEIMKLMANAKPFEN